MENTNLGVFGNGQGNSFNPANNAYNGGTLKAVTIKSDSGDNGNSGTFGNQLLGNLGGILGGVGSVIASANAHKAEPDVINNYTTPPPEPNNNLLYIGIAVVAVVVVLFIFKGKK